MRSGFKFDDFLRRFQAQDPRPPIATGVAPAFVPQAVEPRKLVDVVRTPPPPRPAAKTSFVLTGFTDDVGFRIFAFQTVGADGARLDFTVKADLDLSRKYGILLQELPLLCRGMLERLPEGADAQTVTFTEERMRLHAEHRAAEREAGRQRKAPRRPATEQAASQTT